MADIKCNVDSEGALIEFQSRAEAQKCFDSVGEGHSVTPVMAVGAEDSGTSVDYYAVTKNDALQEAVKNAWGWVSSSFSSLFAESKPSYRNDEVRYEKVEP